MRARNTRRDARVACVVGMCILFVDFTSSATDPVKKCEAEKLLGAGDREACLAAAQADAVLGKPSDPASCEAAFDADILKADDRAAKDGVSCRFIDNADGTIRDLNTLLTWEKKDQAGGVHDVDTLYTWAEAAEWAQNLNGRWTGTAVDAFASRTDWRLPSLPELRTILLAEAFSCPQSPCVDSVFNNGGNSFTAESKYWTSTTTTFIPTKAHAVDFINGVSMLGIDKTEALNVRAVRGNR